MYRIFLLKIAIKAALQNVLKRTQPAVQYDPTNEYSICSNNKETLDERRRGVAHEYCYSSSRGLLRKYYKIKWKRDRVTVVRWDCLWLGSAYCPTCCCYRTCDGHSKQASHICAGICTAVNAWAVASDDNGFVLGCLGQQATTQTDVPHKLPKNTAFSVCYKQNTPSSSEHK